MPQKRWMVLRNAFKTGTIFSTQGAANKALDQMVLRYRREEFYMVEIEYEESEKECEEAEAQYKLSFEGQKNNVGGERKPGCCD